VASSSDSVKDITRGVWTKGLVIGGVALGLTGVGGLFDPTQFFHSYLFAYIFWVNIAVGCLSVLCIQHMTGGRWGFAIRRVLEAGTRLLPFLALFFVPILLGRSRIYPWADPAVLHGSGALARAVAQKAFYFGPLFFIARVVFYFSVWSLLAFFLSRWSLELDGGRNLKLERQVRSLAGGGLLLLGLTITFSSIDWAMSIEPQWSSAIYGMMFMVGQALAALSFVILVMVALRKEESIREVLSTGTSHDLGTLLFAFVMLWGYIELSQFLIIWSANLPEEIPWYIKRTGGAWQGFMLLLLVLQFAIPFAMLLQRAVKRNPVFLARVALLVLVGRAFDLYWVLMPGLGQTTPWPHFMDVTAFIGLGGLFVAGLAREIASRRLVPPQEAPESVTGHAA
jgi:hypothetical protein